MKNKELDNVINLYNKFKNLNNEENTSKKIVLYNMVNKIIELGDGNINLKTYEKEKTRLEKSLKDSGITIEK